MAFSQSGKVLRGCGRVSGRPDGRLSVARVSRKAQTIVCKAHKICVLSGDGIGPEITNITTKVLTAAGKKEGEEFIYDYALIGGAAIDATGKPLPEETLNKAKASDSVLLAAIGG